MLTQKLTFIKWLLPAVFLLCQPGAVLGAVLPNAKTASGDFLFKTSEVLGEIEAVNPDGIGGKWVPVYDGASGVNLYAYCHNDPVNKYDRLGLDVPADKESAIAKVQDVLKLTESLTGLTSAKVDFLSQNFGAMYFGTQTIDERQHSRRLDEAIDATAYFHALNINEAALYRDVVSTYPEGTLSEYSFRMLNEAAKTSALTGGGMGPFWMGENGNLFIPESGALSSATLFDPLAAGIFALEAPAEAVAMGVDQLPLTDSQKTQTLVAANIALIAFTKKAPTGLAATGRGRAVMSEYRRFRSQGYTAAQARYLTMPYAGPGAPTTKMGQHFFYRKYIDGVVGRVGATSFRGRFLNSFRDSRFNLIHGQNMNIGRFYEYHARLHRTPKFGLRRPAAQSWAIPRAYGGGRWRYRNVIDQPTPWGNLGYIWHGSPWQLKAAAGAGTGGVIWGGYEIFDSVR